jgi:exodeoxyribonuclease VII small subunit
MTKKQNFESAMKRLEEIVSELEGGETQLDQMLKVYEEGAQLIRFCLGKLDDAEKKVKKLVGDEQEGFSLESFEE